MFPGWSAGWFCGIPEQVVWILLLALPLVSRESLDEPPFPWCDLCSGE